MSCPQVSQYLSMGGYWMMMSSRLTPLHFGQITADLLGGRQYPQNGLHTRHTMPSFVLTNRLLALIVNSLIKCFFIVSKMEVDSQDSLAINCQVKAVTVCQALESLRQACAGYARSGALMAPLPIADLPFLIRSSDRHIQCLFPRAGLHYLGQLLDGAVVDAVAHAVMRA